MFHIRLRAALPLVVAAIGCSGPLAAPASAEDGASITVQPELAYNVTTLTIKGTAACDGGGVAGVDVADGSLEQMFRGGVGGPIAIRLDGPVMVDCDGAQHDWAGRLVAPGRALPNESGGTVTVALRQGPTVRACTGAKPVRIVG